jgi:hypothetical protein
LRRGGGEGRRKRGRGVRGGLEDAEEFVFVFAKLLHLFGEEVTLLLEFAEELDVVTECIGVLPGGNAVPDEGSGTGDDDEDDDDNGEVITWYDHGLINKVVNDENDERNDSNDDNGGKHPGDIEIAGDKGENDTEGKGVFESAGEEGDQDVEEALDFE